jgi:hypothetical protein
MSVCLKFTLVKKNSLDFQKKIPNLKQFGISFVCFFSFFLSADEFNFYHKEILENKNSSLNYHSYYYERSPDQEIKSFLPPPLNLHDPKLEIAPIKTEIPFFTPFLKEQKSFFPLSVKSSKIYFLAPFYPSIYENVAPHPVATLPTTLFPKILWLQPAFENSLNYPLTLTECTIQEFSLPSHRSTYSNKPALSFYDCNFAIAVQIVVEKRNLLIPKNLFFPSLAKQSSLVAKFLSPSPKFTLSPIKESSSLTFCNLSKVDLPIICEDVLAKLYTPTWRLQSTNWSYAPCLNNNYLEKTPLEPVFAMQMLKPIQSTLAISNNLQKKASPHLCYTSASLDNQFREKNLPIELNELVIERIKPPKTTNKESITYAKASVFETKQTFSYTSYLEAPRPLVQTSNHQSPQSLNKLQPKKSVHGSIAYTRSEPIIHLQKSEKIYLPFEAKQVTYNLVNLSFTEPEKFPLLASLSFLNPKINSKSATLKSENSKCPLYVFAKEVHKPSFLKKNETIALAFTNLKLFEARYFSLTKSSSLTFATLSLPKHTRNFTPVALAKDRFEKLVKLYPGNKKSYATKIFTYHHAIISAFQETECMEKYIAFEKSPSNLIRPPKIAYQISLPSSSFSLNDKLKAAIVHLDSIINDKETIFPKKQFIETATLLCSTEILKSPEILFVYTHLDASPINLNINIEKATVSNSLICLNPFSISIASKMHTGRTDIPLKQIKEISEYAFMTGEAHSTNRNNRQVLYHIGDLPTLEDLQTYSLNDEFKIEAHVLPKPDRSGYAFSLQLSPYDHECINPIPNHVYFILDRSSSIESHRFSSFKSGIVQALSQLHESTLFNIFTFDQNYDKLSSDDLRPSKSSIQYVKRNLDKVAQKWSSSFITLLTLLEEIQNQAKKSDEPYTVVILSNGQFLKNLRYNKEALHKLFHQNSSNFSICTAAISDNNNTFMLDLLAKLGRGEFLYSQTHSAFPRKLAVLMKRLQRPLASDVCISLATSNEKVNFSHFTQTAPLLFADKLYHIYGETEKLEDLHVVIQGKSGDKWINIVKKIDLKKAEKSKEIAKEISSKEALAHIMNYIFTSDQNELTAAKALIAPFDIKWSL